VISRPEGSSTATGFAKQHAAQQLHIVSKAFEAPAGKQVKAAVKETVAKMAHVGAD
jgi:2-oxoglutarate dehydrogenase E1 component